METQYTDLTWERRCGRNGSGTRTETYRVWPSGHVARLKAGGEWVLVHGVRTPDGYKQSHQIVLETFRGPRPSPEHEVCHRDDNPENGDIGNLYWGTRADNVADAFRNGSRKVVLRESDRTRIEELRRRGATYESIALEYGCGTMTVHTFINQERKLTL